MSAVPKCAPSREPLSPAEIARRAEIAQGAGLPKLRDDLPSPEEIPGVDTCLDALRAAGRQAPSPSPWPGTSPMDQWIATDGALRRWRPIIDTIEVIPLPNGERTLRMGGNTCRLSRELAQHLGKLLMGGD